MKQHRGDTLIEVMIAMAIIGSVIAISYGTASRALRVGRAAQERTEAVKLVEAQIEILKNAASNTTSPTIFSTSAGSFCMNSSGGIVDQNAPTTDLESDTLATGATGAPGVGQTYHLDCATGPDLRYKLSIVRQDTGSGVTGRSTFIVRARWLRIGGGKDEVKIYYKLHRGIYQ